MLPPHEMVYIYCLTYLLTRPVDDPELLDEIKVALRSTRCWPGILTCMENHKSDHSQL
jgi:hypothetical protein